MKDFTDHTEQLKQRIAAIAIKEEDSCAFFKLSETAVEGENQCGDCYWSDFGAGVSSIETDIAEGKCLCHFSLRQLHKSEMEFLRAKEAFEAFVSNMNGGAITCIFDTNTLSSRSVYINEGWTAITGYTLEELKAEMGGNPQALVLPEDKEKADLAYTEQIENSNQYDLLYRLTRKDGNIIWVIDRGRVTVLENGYIQNQSIMIDVTELKVREERLTQLAQIDQLTQLNNKTTASIMIQGVLERYSHKKHAVMIIDIDNFKSINDSKGHAFGDKVLREVADCLKSLFRSMDILGRIGGDEFMVLMVDILSVKATEKKAAEVCEAIRRLCAAEKGYPPVSISIGLSIFSGESKYQQLYEQADSALYEAKRKGKDQYCSYRSENL